MTRNYYLLTIAAFLLSNSALAFASDTTRCSDHRISASAVRTTSDVQAFVRCAAEYLTEHGTAEARRAFNEEEYWKHGPTYVFVDSVARSGESAIAHVYPPDPSREGTPWGSSVDIYGSDPFAETYRVLSIVDAGWVYSSFQNPETGRNEPKSSYIIKVDWNGDRAVIGAGIHAPDLPGSCDSDAVNAAALAAKPSEQKLREFVRCAALLVEKKGYFAKSDLTSNSRWRHGSVYVFAMDLAGNQVLTGNRVRVNGNALHEWGIGNTLMEQFGGRDIVAVGDTFGEALIYYRGRDPVTGAVQPKVGFLKRVVSHGVPLIVGAGYRLGSESAVAKADCKDNTVSARGIRTRKDIEAFVRCAAQYVQEHGTEEARRAFHEDARWRHGPYYLFVDLVAEPDEAPLSHIAVFPPRPAWEGTSQTLVDNFGTDYFHELHRVMTFADSGWLHYSFTNFLTGKSEPKSSYVVEIEWDSHRAVVGAGIYLRDLPGTCYSEEVNAAALEAKPSEDKLQELVRCAAAEIESQGYFSKGTLGSDPRWNSGPIYVFALDEHGGALFSGDPLGRPSGQGLSEISPLGSEPFGGRDVVAAATGFGEAFLYYSARDPSTGMSARKVALAKRAVIGGLAVLVGSGYYPTTSTQPGQPGEGDGPAGGPADGGQGVAGRGDAATLLYWQAPTILNPYLSRGTKDTEAASLVLEPLAEYDPDAQLVAVLATRIPTLENGGVSEDLTQITWTLREGVVWSDGTPFTAHDVVFTWHYCTAPGSGCAATRRFDHVASVDAADDRTVTVTFAGPESYPYGPFVSSSSPVLQASQFAHCVGAAAAGCSAENLGPVGTGPYVVTDFSGDGTIRYRFNPHYRGAAIGQPYFSEVVLRGGGDAASAARSVLQLKEADYAWNLQVEPRVLASISSGDGGTVVSAFSTLVERLVLNQTNPDARLGDLRSEYAGGTNPHPFLTDAVVGRALSLVIDRETLARTGYGEHAGRPACNIWTEQPSQASRRNDECLVQNVPLANKILDDAGIVDSDGDGVRERDGVALRILFQTSTNSVRQAAQEHIKAWWGEIGVETELKHIDASVFFGGDPSSPDTVGRFYADVQMFARSSSGPDPEGYFGAWTTGQIPGADNSFLGGNLQRYHSEEYDRLYEELQHTVDAEERKGLAIALNDLLLRSYSIIPLVERGAVSAHGSDIEGVRMNAWDSELWNFEEWRRRE